MQKQDSNTKNMEEQLPSLEKSINLISKNRDASNRITTCWNYSVLSSYPYLANLINGNCHCGDFYTSNSCSSGWGCKGNNGEFYCNPSYWVEKCC